jgi:DNA-binding response OmpR family regulator
MPGGVVLLVEQDLHARERIGGWLEEAGFDVLACPGPSKPDYTCVAGRTGSCPLAQAADLLILDLSLEGDALMEGTSAFDLLSFYLASERPVIALRRGYESTPALLDEDISVLAYPPDRRQLLKTARVAMRDQSTS